MLAFAFLLDGAIMVLVPLLAGVWAARRLGTGLGVFAAGAATFFVSQVVHIPLNLAVARGFSQGLLPIPPAWTQAWLLPIALGLSAGLCEEVARWVALRWGAKSWERGVVFGLGHGGFESMIVGALVFLTLTQMVALREADLSARGIPAEALPFVAAQVEKFWSVSWPVVFAGALERVLAMTCHVGFTLLVLRGPGGLALAVLAHAALDAGAVALAPHGALVAELYILGFAAGSVALIVRLRPRVVPETVPTMPPPPPPHRVPLDQAARGVE